MDSLLGLYLKLNILLCLALALWLGTRQAARWLRFELSQAAQLGLARRLFLVFLYGVPLFWLADSFVPQWLSGPLGSVPGSQLAREVTVSASIEGGLGAEYALGGRDYPLAGLLLGLLLAGLALRGGALLLQWRRLRRTVREGIAWKSMHEVDILFSERCATPFSTRALGRFHVVLPYRLLHSPGCLRIALQHEFQHIRNGDLSWILGLEALKLCCFWNPAAYAWYREFDWLQEAACDEVVTARRVGREDYGHCLLELASAAGNECWPAATYIVPPASRLFGGSCSQLRRRLLSLGRLRGARFARLRAALYNSLFGAGLLAASLVVLARAESIADADAVWRQNYQPIRSQRPVYPERALELRLTGDVRMEFSVDAEGRVYDARVKGRCVQGNMERQLGGEYCSHEYAEVFDEVSLAALEDFRFLPRLVDGEPVDSHKVQYSFRYLLKNVDMVVRVDWRP